MLSLLSTILGWDDSDRERAGLQRGAKRPAAPRRKSTQRTAEEQAAQAAMNESFSNLFVEFLLKEASQGESVSPPATSPNLAFSPRSTPATIGLGSPPPSGSGTPRNQRTLSSTSLASIGEAASAPKGIGIGRKQSFGLQEAMGRQ
jgi:hypothetical protein